MMKLILSILILTVNLLTIYAKLNHYQYCIIGSGPGGLQIAYYLQQAKRNYIIFERNNQSGSFFSLYPRHRRLLSINKIQTGNENYHFNLRHDWNSLLSHDDSLRMSRYSKDYYPHADDMVRYLNNFANRLQLNIQYNTNIIQISRGLHRGVVLFLLRDQNKTFHLCNVTIISTGLSKPNNHEDVVGIQYTEGYESVSVNSSDFIDKNVLILGQGNSAFETAQAISHTAGLLHLHGRNRLRIATSTHYIGDIRAVNSRVIDSYQLKTLDGLVEGDIRKFGFIKTEDGKIRIGRLMREGHKIIIDTEGIRTKYHHVIRCLGFLFDNSIFKKGARPKMRKSNLSRYPKISSSYESVTVPHMFFAGSLVHSLDYRHSGGCCIQGFRYAARALHYLLEWRYHRNPWPSISIKTTHLLNHVMTRINQASGLYQMFAILTDVILIGDDHQHQYLKEIPILVLPELSKLTGHMITHGFITLTFEYGKNFSEPGTDTLGTDNFSHTAKSAHRSKNIHPILRYYSRPFQKTERNGRLPTPDKVHHVVEDFLSDWTSYNHHTYQLQLFLQTLLKVDLNEFYADSCFKTSMISKSMPLSCSKPILQR